MQEPAPYCAYLIRLWPTVRGGVAGCRVSLRCVATGERKDFPDLDRLVAFLRAQGEEWENQERREEGSDHGTGQSALQR